MIIEEEKFLAHYGIRRQSGRYPWGSGGTENQRSKTFMDTLAELREKGMKDTEIARGFGMSVRELRETNTIARNVKKQADIAQATALKDKAYSNVAIGEKMGINESSVRALLAEGVKERADILSVTSAMLQEQVDTRGYIDVGKGVENQLGISKEKLGSAVALLKDEGYAVHKVQVEQQGTSNMTTVKVLAPPGTTYRDIVTNMDKINQIKEYSDDGGRTFYGLLPPKSLDSKRVGIRYDEEGGGTADGVIYVRPGKEDLSLGGSRYAQVRVLVDDTHYIKGMAIYKDDLPDGVDVLFNTNKSDTGNKLDALKPITEDADNPFGAMVDQIGNRDDRGRLLDVTSVMNVVNKEGDWEGWKKSISSQVLSKQSPKLAKQQLDEAYNRKKAELDEILALNNPSVRKKLLKSYSDSADSSAVHLKAAALPRQASQVILPVESLKSNEIYAPNYNHGERVALIRYPHGGTFEIPELTVNNNHPEAKALIGPLAKDAVGINSKVAAHLSGADYDGDTVLVIPNGSGAIKSQPALEGLKGFDPQRLYKNPEGVEFKGNKQMLMGDVSNLITDMTIKGASTTELAAAVRHSMVVIDAEKKNLNYKLSAERNGIANLKRKYQGAANAGASTLVSRATSPLAVNKRRPRPVPKGGPIDKATGKKEWEDHDPYIDRNGKTAFKKQFSVKLAETDDAHTLSSGTKIEEIYADHSNRMKALANLARKEEINTSTIIRSSSAAKIYKNEVDRLDGALREALSNSPRERQAQLLAAATLAAKRQANPNMDHAQIKKIQAQALAEMRVRTGARKPTIMISDREWEAIQAGAISPSKLKAILDNADIERVKELATPRAKLLMTGANLSKAKALQAAGRTQSEIATILGVSLSTVKEGLK